MRVLSVLFVGSAPLLGSFGWFAGAVSSGSGLKKRTLVLLDSVDQADNEFSEFFQLLKGRNHELTVRAAADMQNALEKYGEYLYDNVLVFAPGADDFGAFDASDLLTFVNDAGGNVLVALDVKIGEATREFVAHCGFSLYKEGEAVVDDFTYDAKDSGDHTLFHTDQVVSNGMLLGGGSKSLFQEEPLLFKGVGVKLNNKKGAGKQVLRFGIARAKRTAYNAEPSAAAKTMPSQQGGKGIVLVSGVQARNNARVIVSGSIDMFKNSLMNQNVALGMGNKEVSAHSGNRKFADGITKWNFGEAGVLRAGGAEHRRVVEGGEEQKWARGNSVYRVGDKVEYRLRVEEWHGTDGAWRPFAGKDIPFKMVLLEPKVNKTLTDDAGDGLYTTLLRAPEQSGVYKLSVNYDRLGYSSISSTVSVTVRPIGTGDQDHFVVASYPYYASFILLLVAFGKFLAAFKAAPEKGEKGE
eukprot:g966.t1